ncbi:MAG TPA: uroporphyrinogen decarboxylase [Candidatus Baltobacteraceae bacterium]|nr:uroporphyrinogen decarboxylase [Candidatus Baltobacteraceae bacterium]
MQDFPFLKACRREATPFTPVWLMRQAGRYLPEYRRVRDRFSFIELCRDSSAAAQVTVDTVRRLGVDAAIIFADILLPLIPMGLGLTYEKGDGPRIARTIRSAADVDAIAPVDVRETLGFVAETVRLVVKDLENEAPVIGFAGAPFTVASYAIEGGGSKNYIATKKLMHGDPQTWHRFMSVVANLTVEYLNMQIDAGAHVVQLFDSWVGALSPEDYREFVLPHSRTVISNIKAGTPVIHFGTMTGSLLPLMRDAGGDIIGLDWRVELDEGWTRLGDTVGVQGNLDPVLLFTDPGTIRSAVQDILRRANGRPGHIFNLGHGILPETPVDNVLALIDAVHEMSRT